MQKEFTFDFDDFQDINSDLVSQKSTNPINRSHNKIQTISKDQFKANTLKKGYFYQSKNNQQNQSHDLQDSDSPTKLFQSYNHTNPTNLPQSSQISKPRRNRTKLLQPLQQNSSIRLRRQRKQQSFLQSKQISNNMNIQYIDKLIQYDNNDDKYEEKKVYEIQSLIFDDEMEQGEENQKGQGSGEGKQQQQQNKQQKQQQKQEQQRDKRQKFVDIMPQLNQYQLKQDKQLKQQQQNKKKTYDQLKVLNNPSHNNNNEQNLSQISQPHSFTQPINITRILSSPIPQKMTMKTVVERNGGFMNIWPQFHVIFQSDQCYLMSGKKVSRTPYSTYLFSMNNEIFQQNHEFYLGKAKSTVLGDQLDIYGVGLNPKDAMEKGIKPRQLNATVVYETRYFQGGVPRNFKVYVKDPTVDYYAGFPQVKMYEDQIPLNILYKNPHNKHKIFLLRNRKPEYRKQMNGYMLNFKGRVSKASVKNFILQKIDDPLNQVMIFGKFQDQKYHMDISYPLSPCVAFGVVLSTFDSKFFCQ